MLQANSILFQWFLRYLHRLTSQMKSMRKIAILFLTTILIISCSDDGDDGSDNMSNGTSPIVGTWVLTDLRIDSSVDDDDLDFAKQIVSFLQGIDCDLITFTFNDDGTVTSVDRASFLSINVGMGGLDIPCPMQSETEASTWSLNGNQLTFINANMEEETLVISFEGDDTLILAGADIDPDNFTGADAVFTRQ